MSDLPSALVKDGPPLPLGEKLRFQPAPYVSTPYYCLEHGHVRVRHIVGYGADWLECIFCWQQWCKDTVLADAESAD